MHDIDLQKKFVNGQSAEARSKTDGQTSGSHSFNHSFIL
jgi:hypothetical protein